MNTMQLRLNVNGESKEWTVAPGDLLLDVLRREGYHGVKRGCESGECGACTVLLNGKAVNSCMVFAGHAEGGLVITIEGVSNGTGLHRVQEAMLDHGAVQCGFCTGGIVVSSVSLLDRTPAPNEEQVREMMAGHLCRCTGYKKIVEAVVAAAGVEK